MRFYLPILVFIIFLSCRSSSAPNASADRNFDKKLIEVQKLNPDEAIIEVSIKRSNLVEGIYMNEAEILSVKRMGFAFNLNLNKGDIIGIESKDALNEASGIMVLEQQANITSDKKRLLFKYYVK